MTSEPNETPGCDDALARALAREHRMHYEAEPEVEFEHDGSKRRVGFRFRIFGAHLHGSKPQPGCVLCTDLHADLKRVAASAVPSNPLLLWDLVPFSPSLSWDPAADADEVSLFVVGATRDSTRGVSAEEEQEASAVQRRLEEIGVRHGNWRRVQAQ